MRRVSKGARRMGVAVAAGALLVAAPFVASQAQAGTPGPSGIKAKGAFLLDGSGNAMWGKGADTRREMASTTKVMTAAVVVSSPGVDLNRRITVQKAYRDYVTKWGASTADLRTGDKMTLRQLLYATLLPSGCDAAYALADAVGTGHTRAARTKSFIGKMNAKARQLGMTHTEYDSFDGISKQGHNHSTARDMSKLGKYALGSSALRAVVKSTSTKQKATNGRTYTWYNTNRLLGSYKGVMGIKTGTGGKAGHCLIFAAQRGGRTVVGAILNSADRYPDAKKMLDWAFKQKTPTLDLRSLPVGAQRD